MLIVIFFGTLLSIMLYHPAPLVLALFTAVIVQQLKIHWLRSQVKED